MRKISKNSNAKELSEEKLKELKHNAALILDVCRRNILNANPFFGQVMMQLELTPIRDVKCATACTDGKSIYFDIDFLSQLNEKQREFVLAHELLHNIMIHFTRRDNRDPKLFNYATDCEVNEILVKENFETPPEVLLPSTFNFPSGLSAEEYYDLLMKEAEKNGSKSNMNGDGESSPENGNGSMSVNNRLKGQFDKHEYNDSASDEGSGGEESCEDQYGKVGSDPDFRPKPTEAAAEKIREIAVSVIQQIARQHGNVPGHLERLVNKLVEPEINWKEVLSQFITKSTGESNRTWNRPNRRFAARGLYLPSASGEKIKIALGIDTSGSTCVETDTFIAEVKEIVETAGEYELTIIHCDTEVNKTEFYDSMDNPFDPNVEEYSFAGGGGTNLLPIFDHVVENELDVDAIVMFTDGAFDKITQADLPDGLPVLWVITKDGYHDALPENSRVVDFKNAA